VLERIPHLPRMMDYVCHVTNNQVAASGEAIKFVLRPVYVFP
jgi:hypothetical protein